MSDDLLYNCAESYRKLMNYEYEFQIAVNKTVKKFTLIFEDSQFKHLSGLEKLSDNKNFALDSSKVLFNKILNKELTMQDVTNSPLANKRINENLSSTTSYYVVDRIKELMFLHDNLHNLTNENLQIHIWNRNCEPQNRPHHSSISADYLFVFQNTATRKSLTETTCTFFLETEYQHTVVGKSIFPTDISYSDDGSISVERCQILSVNEIDKEQNISTNIIYAPEELWKKAYSDSISKSQSITIKQDIKALKSKRKDFSIKRDTKSQIVYQRKIDIFSNTNIYSVDMLNEVLRSLTSQLESPNNKDVWELIEKEIKSIQNEIISRESNKNTDLSSDITIMQSVRNDNGTITMTKPIVTIETPQTVIKAKSQIEKGTHLADSSIRNFFTDIKDLFKNLFKKQDKPIAAVLDTASEKKANVSEISDSIEKTTISKEMSALMEAREALAAKSISQEEYQKTLRNLMYSLHGKEMWIEATETLHKQLDECPDNIKSLIQYELKNLEKNIEKKFTPKRQQTLDEIKSAAHKQYVKQQNENKSAEKEITTKNSKSER